MGIGGPRTYGRPWGATRRAFAAGLVAFGAEAAAQDDPARPRFLVVYEQDATLPANIQIAAGIESVLAAAAPAREVFTEHLDLTRFPEPANRAAQAALMASRYSGMPLDAVLVAGPSALGFVLEYREAFAPGAPVVFGAVGAQSTEGLSPDVRGVVSGFDLQQTLGLARRLQPDARRIVVVTGSAGFDRSWDTRAREELAGLTDAFEIDHVSGLTLEGFQAMAADLPPDTILLIFSVYEDAAGRSLVPREAAGAIAEAASVPAYSVYSTFIGRGVLGGYVETFPRIGEAMARLGLDAAAGRAGDPAVVNTVPEPVVDWRQVERFGIDPDLLPPGTERLYYEPSGWDRYRPQIIGAIAIILAQGATIAALIVQDRRRRRIAEELAVERLELAHLSRTEQLGALSGALAHELSQPLASILANAEAGAKLIARDPPEVAEVADILADIAADDRRAAGIISQLRRLMVKGDTALEDVDLNQVAAATVALARGELVARQTRAEVRRGQPEVMVRGNFAQLQQVVLNLMLNAADAMAELPPDGRQMEIETKARDDGRRELAVIDRGRGLAPEMREGAFKPFVTSKKSGLGFGLSICRSIARAHGGTLAFDPEATAGTRVVLTLPAP